MTVKEISEIIELLPMYLCYIYPGYITMFLFYYFRALTLSDTKAKVIKSIVLSYLYIIMSRCYIIPRLNALACFNISNQYDSLEFNIVLIILAVVVPYLIYMFLYKNGLMEKILRKLGIETTMDRNEIQMLQRKYSDNIWIYVYLKNGNIMYEGSLTEQELEHGKSRFFCLSKYRKRLIKTNGKLKTLADYSQDEKEKVLIYFDQISHFEIANVDKQE